MKQERILIIENSIHITGALNAVLRTSFALRENYDFVFVLPVGSGASALVKESGFEVVEIPMLEISKRWQSIVFYIPRLFQSVYRVRKIVKAHKISMVHVNDFYNLIMPLWKLCGGGVPYICYVNFVPARFPLLLRKLWINSHMVFSNNIITVSHHVLKQLPESAKVLCIPCALPVEQNLNLEEYKKEKVLLFLGNFMEGKGQDLAIRSFAIIAKLHPDWKLRMVGGTMGMEKNKAYQISLMHLSQELEIADQLEWSSFSETVMVEYQRAAIALNFSRSESFSLTVQEAMFYGCPVIATRSGGPTDIIDDQYSGLLVPVDNVAAMADAMKYLIENPDERLRLMSNARKSIRDKFGKANTIDKLDLVYRDIVG